MNGKVFATAITALLAGVVLGAGGWYVAQSQGLLEKVLGVRPALGVAEHQDGPGAAAHKEGRHDEHEAHEGEEAHDEDDGHDHGADDGHGHGADDGHGHEDGHGTDDGHGHEDEHGHEAVKLSERVLDEVGIEVREAGPGTLQISVVLPGEVVLNPDRVAHIVPRAGGIVRRVNTSVGDRVEQGDIMAVLESRELAEAKAEYLAARQRLELARANLAANEELKRKGIVPELDYLAARRDVAEAQIALGAAEYRLHVLGVTNEELADETIMSDALFSVYELRAPFGGEVISRHIALGEVVTPETEVFELADLSDVWVNITVYQKNLRQVRAGQRVLIKGPHGVGTAEGEIAYVSPVVDEATRTAVARVVLSNDEGNWRPGLFVSAAVEIEQRRVDVMVPLSALQTLEGRPCVFVETDEGFVPQPVELGLQDDTNVEILSGLAAGQRYAARGAFTLKAELGKEAFAGAGHSH